jgi:predicted lipoprotein with Yx(FWY)xxD motif
MTIGQSREPGDRHRRLFRSLAVVIVALIIGATRMGPASAAVPTVAVADNATFGPILTTGTGMALYTLDTDHNGQSTCHGSCAAVWPPLNMAPGTVPTGGPGVTGTVASSMQSNGTVQVTYNGAPVYTFVGDTSPGAVTGNNVSGFFVVKVTPVSVTTTTAPATTSSGPSAPTGSSAPEATAAPAPTSSPTASGTGATPSAGARPGTPAASGSLAFTGTGPGLVLSALSAILMLLLGGLALIRSSDRKADVNTGS